jgi:hypothetical protein
MSGRASNHYKRTYHLLTRRHRTPRRRPQNDTQWKREVHEQMTLEFANVSDGDGEAEDYGAYFLEDGHGVFSE